ncbi:MAG: tyrosine--tRNA ligase [Firmicutes bacterium]|nr:tyrosine--tRNA ligase [Bacillota bacterium]
MKLYEELKWRGVIKDEAGEDLEKKLNDEIVTFYWGTDPTADSLHLGHYSSLVTAKRLAKYGHKPILLVGGSTGLIGDPRPTSEREIISKETLNKNLEGISKQVSDIFEGKAEMVNNYDWTKDYTLLEFLRDIGKYINVNYMLNKDIISRRLDTGITFAEFTYTLLQGYDFLWLYENKNCIMQVEGSDQWGNITTGIELIRKKLNKEAYAFTMPLILDKFGNKFGKSAGNALWLDKNKTSSYELYQYLINTDDEMVIHYLKVFTFLTKEEIEQIEKEQLSAPESRVAQKALAREIITDIRGKEEYEHAKYISECLFSEKVTELSSEDIINSLKGVPTVEVELDVNILDFLVNNKIVSSKREAREFVSAGAISLNNKKISDLEYIVTNKDTIEDKLIIVKRGKKNYYLAKVK